MNIKIWEIHSQACKIEKAEKSCKDLANKAAVQWCGPYVNANQYGFWVYSPIDLDFIFKDGELKILNLESYTDEDFNTVKNLVRPEDNSSFEKWIFPGVGRTKTTFGLIENNVIQIWTGLIFQTPPGWCLQIRSPINFPYAGYSIVEAVLETDWLQYDIWMNIAITLENKQISIRKDIPIAQLIPLRREGFKGDWDLNRERINRNSKEADDVFKYWIHYNKQKFEFGGRQALTETLTKDATTYFKEKNRLIGKEMEPNKEVEKCPQIKSESKCPYAHLHNQPKQTTPEYQAVNSFVYERFSKKQ